MYFRSFLGKACTNNMVVTGFGPTGVLICKYGAADMLAGALIGPDNTIPMWTNNGKTFVSSVLSQQGRQIRINGNLKIGMDPSSVCAGPNTAGQRRYNATNKKIEFCDGTIWKVFDTTPVGAIMPFYQYSCPE